MTSTRTCSKFFIRFSLTLLLLYYFVGHEVLAFSLVPLLRPRAFASKALLVSNGAADDRSSAASLTTTPARATTSLPKRKKKKRTTKRKANKNNIVTGPITEQDLADHVSFMYIHGPGGVLRDSSRRRQRRQDELKQKRIGIQPAEQDHDDDNDHDDQGPNNLCTSAGNEDTIRNLDRHPALLLNANFQPMSYLPLSLWNWQEAVKAIFSGKVTVVDVYPDVTIRAANLEVPLPSVIALTEYVPQYDQTPAFTKRNVFLRDEYRCQYCNDLFHTRDLSLDHVVPRCKGGRLHWENAVTSCRKCNGRKGSMDLHEIKRLGMRLLRMPRTPTQYELAATASRMLPRKVHPTWEPYLGIVSSAKDKNSPTSRLHTTSSLSYSNQEATFEEES